MTNTPLILKKIFPILQKIFNHVILQELMMFAAPSIKSSFYKPLKKKNRLAVGVCYTQKDFNLARKSSQIIQHLLRELLFLTTKQTLILWLKCLQLRKNIFVLHSKFNHNESRTPFSWTIKPNFFTFVICT